jgi:hypothetical protein
VDQPKYAGRRTGGLSGKYQAISAVLPPVLGRIARTIAGANVSIRATTLVNKKLAQRCFSCSILNRQPSGSAWSEVVS